MTKIKSQEFKEIEHQGNLHIGFITEIDMSDVLGPKAKNFCKVFIPETGGTLENFPYPKDVKTFSQYEVNRKLQELEINYREKIVFTQKLINKLTTLMINYSQKKSKLSEEIEGLKTLKLIPVMSQQDPHAISVDISIDAVELIHIEHLISSLQKQKECWNRELQDYQTRVQNIKSFLSGKS